MQLRSIYTLLILLAAQHVFAQPVEWVFYNTENLFDTIDDASISDEEFTPAGLNGHTSERYKLKIKNLSDVLNAINESGCAGIIGLCEVENENVVNDLKNAMQCGEAYGLVHFDSPDMRGIDNAFLFNTEIFELKEKGLEAIDLGEEERPTRGIVWAKLYHMERETTFFVYINHWPSRYGGQAESEWKRLQASKTLITLMSKHKVEQPEALTVVMGDLNDHPENQSVKNLELCEAGPCLYNLMKHLQEQGKGTHAYRGEWGVLDHILVSGSMIDSKSGWSVKQRSGEAVSYDWMLYTDKDGSKFPSRFYGSKSFFGGYSDHLPVKIQMNYLQ